MKLSELVSIKQEECPVCLSYIYSLPANTDDRFFGALRVFGRERYSMSVIDLFKIEDDQFYIESSRDTKQVKIWFKKELGQTEINRRVHLLEECLRSWLSDIFDSDIEDG